MNDSVFNIVVSNKCNAKCPYCISKQTPNVCKNYTEFNYRRLSAAIQYAVRAGIQTCKLTGKGGDPLCEQSVLDDVIRRVRHDFPIIELQTNGILLNDSSIDFDLVSHLSALGVTIMAISCVHWSRHINANIYHNFGYSDLSDLADQIHSVGLSMRVSCTLIKEYIDTAEKIQDFLAYFKDKNIEQFSFIPVGWNGDNKEARWAKKHQVPGNVWDRIKADGTLLWETSYGGSIYDYYGRNVYIADCLASPVSEIRSLIYYPDGHLRYSWTKPGAIIF